MKPKTSDVWKYFTEINNSQAECKICKKIYSKTGRTTSGLIQHLQRDHDEKYKEFLNLKRKRPTNVEQTPLTLAKKQQTINEAFNSRECWPSTHEKTIEMDKLVAEMVALQNLPFNFVEGIGIHRVLKAALPRYKLRGREHFTKLLCNDLYTQMATTIKELLNGFEKLSFTTDIWTDTSAGVSLLSLTTHAISADMKKFNIVLKCEPIEGSHTSDLISQKLDIMLTEWNIHEKVHCIVHDRGANVVRAMRISEFGNVNCTVHQLQLCIKAGIFSNDIITNVISKAKKICGHFNHSLPAQEELKKIQTETLGQPILTVIQDCPTRWNSTYYMLERLMKIKDSLVLFLSSQAKFTITSEDWKIIEKCVAVLKPFEEITRQLSGGNAIISSVIPLIYVLRSTLEEEKKTYDPIFETIVQKLIDEVNLKFLKIENNDFFSFATYLDPRYKLKFFNSFEKEQVQSKLLDVLINHCQSASVQIVQTSPSTSTNRISPSPPASSNIQSLLDQILESDEEEIDDSVETTDTNLKMKLKLMLQQYNKEKTVKISENPLMWWNFNKHKYPNLISLVRQYLSTPPGSVPSEQLFSGAGLIYDPLRNQLEAEKAARLLFMKYNLPLLEFEY